MHSRTARLKIGRLCFNFLFRNRFLKVLKI
nr:MAG TPA: hypothetical protein [Caudoviricetes sp.]